jgi:cytochrome b561
MAAATAAEKWGAIARLFHWGMLVLLAGIFPLGLYMADLPLSRQKLKLYALHKSIGLTLLALAALRLLWRAGQRRPTLPAMPAWQQRAATAMHVALYALMFLVPLAGWLFNSAAGFPLQWFGQVNLPALAAANPGLKSLAHELHEVGAWTLAAFVALHAAAALKHHFIDRDRTLALMTPGVKAPRTGVNP